MSWMRKTIMQMEEYRIVLGGTERNASCNRVVMIMNGCVVLAKSVPDGKEWWKMQNCNNTPLQWGWNPFLTLLIVWYAHTCCMGSKGERMRRRRKWTDEHFDTFMLNSHHPPCPHSLSRLYANHMILSEENLRGEHGLAERKKLVRRWSFGQSLISKSTMSEITSRAASTECDT